MGIPQTILTILLLLGAYQSVIHDGSYTTINAKNTLIGVIIWFVLLLWGGFYTIAF